MERLRNNNKTVYLINPRVESSTSDVHKDFSQLQNKNIDVLDVVVNPRSAVSIIDAAYSSGIKKFFL